MAVSYQLSPSRVARYFFHECERYLRYFATPRPERKRTGIPNPPYDHSPVTAAILEGGYQWEEEVVTRQLKGRVRVAKAPKGTAIRDCTFDAKETVAALRELEPGEYLYQGTLVAPDGFYRAFGLDPDLVAFTACRPDLILRERDQDGQPVYRIVDVKASDALKTSHKVQTALYALLLQAVLEAHGIPGRADMDQAGIWLYGLGEPEWFDLGVIRAHVEAFLRGEVTRILRAEPAETAWHLHYRCEWCEYFEHCRTEAEETDSVSLVPYLTPLGRSHLRSLGVNKLSDLHRFLRRKNAPALLERCASLSGREDRLRAAVGALLEEEVRPIGGSSLAMPVGEHVRLVLTLQREPVSGRIYAAGLLRTGNNQVFSIADRHDEQYVAERPEDCDRIRRAFIQRLHGMLTELDQCNAGRPWEEQKSLQAYVFDSYEAALLEELLLESLRDPQVSEEALTLLFHFHGEELAAADEHPASETDFPLVVLTDVIRSLLALPIPVAYHIAHVARTLPAEGRDPFDYQPSGFFNFALSNALRSDAIHGAWHHGKTEYLTSIAKELRRRLWAAWSVVDGIRAAAVDPQTGRSALFAWPPKFRLPDTDAFAHPVLSRLAFLTRYESLLSYLEVRMGRTLPRAERERAGTLFSLRALDEHRFVAEPYETASDLESGYGRWLLVEDTADGDRAQMAFPDNAYKDVAWVPRGKPVYYASIAHVEPPTWRRQVVLHLELTAGKDSPPIVKGRRYLLCPAHMDWNSNRVITRLKEIDQRGGRPTCVSLLEDPIGFCRPVDVPKHIRKDAASRAERVGFTPSQKAAFTHLLDHTLTLIWGPPGTGKTHFLAMSILRLVQAYRWADRPLRVLVTAYTHAAIENCLKKIDELSRKHRIPCPLVKLGETKTQGCEHLEAIKVEKGRRYLAEHRVCVVGATTFAMLNLFRNDPEDAPFDVVVIDEGSQVRVPESLLAISRLAPGGRLVVAGDDLQLPPIVRGVYPEPEPGEPLLHRSIFEALREPDRGRERITRQLYENFRMNDVLCRFPALTLYGEPYRSATEAIATQRLGLLPARGRLQRWLEQVLDPAYPLVLCVLEGVQAGAENPVEADLVAGVVKELRRRQTQLGSDQPYPPGAEGDAAFWRDGLFVVSPHHVQIRAIKRALSVRGLHEPFFVDTVDKMQGQECDTVIVSYGVSDAELAMQEGKFIYSLNRLNVAITRARKKCIVFLPRPLLMPTLAVLEDPEASVGVAFMAQLEQYLAEAGPGSEFPVREGRLRVYRKGDVLKGSN